MWMYQMWGEDRLIRVSMRALAEIWQDPMHKIWGVQNFMRLEEAKRLHLKIKYLPCKSSLLKRRFIQIRLNYQQETNSWILVSNLTPLNVWKTITLLRQGWEIQVPDNEIVNFWGLMLAGINSQTVPEHRPKLSSQFRQTLWFLSPVWRILSNIMKTCCPGRCQMCRKHWCRAWIILRSACGSRTIKRWNLREFSRICLLGRDREAVVTNWLLHKKNSQFIKVSTFTVPDMIYWG